MPSINYDAMTYLLLTFGGCLGMYQVAAVAGDFRGLWFFKSPRVTLVTGLLITGATYGWFFNCADLKMNANHAAVVEGHEQLVFFLLGAFLALVVVFVVSSIANRKGIIHEDSSVLGEGLEDLKTRTVWQASLIRWKAHKEADDIS